MKKVLAFDIGGTNMRLALVNEKLEIERIEIRPTVRGDKDAFMNNVVDMISSFDLKDVIAIGAGVPGVVDRDKRVIINLPNVHIENIEFGKIINEKFGFPVFLRNDAEVACLGEAYSGAGKDYSRVFFITISTGLGGAMTVDNGFQDYITEIGHTLFSYKGEPHEFSLVSGSYIQKLAALNNFKIEKAAELFDLYEAGDKKAKEVFLEWENILEKFIRLVVDSYLPDIIVFTGGFMNQKHLFFDDIIKMNPDVLIKECKYKTQAGLVGAATFALKEMKII